MRFQVPQFIEVEDKIFGPLTIKQFVYLAGGAGLSFIIYTYVSPISLILAILCIIPVAAFALSLALYKVNNQPFIYVIEAAFKFMLANKLYIWRKQDRKPEHKKETALAPLVYVPKLSDSKLKDLTWSLDINENLSPGASESMKK
ncbi:MAG: PrgI family protein [bacterium]|nr:PrgI family protein [bacterium]